MDISAIKAIGTSAMQHTRQLQVRTISEAAPPPMDLAARLGQTFAQRHAAAGQEVAEINAMSASGQSDPAFLALQQQKILNYSLELSKAGKLVGDGIKGLKQVITTTG